MVTQLMNTILSIIIIVLLIIAIALLVVLLTRKQSGSNELLEQRVDLASNTISQKIDSATNTLLQRTDATANTLDKKTETLSIRMKELTDKNYEQQIKLNDTLSQSTKEQTKLVADSILQMQKSNEEKLELMRKTVDEKLDQTLNQRLNASFKTVSEELTRVYKSLGEMKELSAGVTTSVSGLNKVLTNVKSRGTWAEVQLANILDQTIPNMYETNVQTNPSYNGRVEFAIKIPNQEDGSITYLPLDSKFPMEDYARLSTASQNGDLEGIESAKKSLERTVRDEAKMIKQYISTPNTTPFAIMYLATEGLYAEITASKTGIAEKLQAENIMIAGPSTITALLNSLAMGFKTIAINKKANEVWNVLGAAKMQYDKFGDLLAKARKKVEEAGKVLDDADKRNNMIQKKLRDVELLDDTQANDILGLEE